MLFGVSPIAIMWDAYEHIEAIEAITSMGDATRAVSISAKQIYYPSLRLVYFLVHFTSCFQSVRILTNTSTFQLI